MTRQEKELIDIIHDINCERLGNSNIQVAELISEAIIAKYPQILAEKCDCYPQELDDQFDGTEIEVFIREVKS